MIEISAWVPAILIEMSLILGGLLAFVFIRGKKTTESLNQRISALKLKLAEANSRVAEVLEEMRSSMKIIKFEDSDMQILQDMGAMEGDPETFTAVKSQVIESGSAVVGLNEVTGSLSGRLAELMEKQMEAINMVGRMGGSGGLPPELKEKAEAILDVFRTLDELLAESLEDVDKIEAGLNEIGAALDEFRDVDPRFKLPTSEELNQLLEDKANAPSDEEDDGIIYDEEDEEDDDDEIYDAGGDSIDVGFLSEDEGDRASP